MRSAILDFGTNTFNLLIVEGDNKTNLSIIHVSKEPVKLGQGGIHRKIITDDAFLRGMKAIEKHFHRIKEFKAEKTYAFATSAIREANNGKAFIREVKDKFNLYVNIIPGEREAELIYKGVRLSCGFTEEIVLIVDIGGGSNELIIANKDKIFWKQSFLLGSARMLELFEPSDPILDSEIKKIEAYLENELPSLFTAIRKFKPVKMIGASGSFETFSALLHNKYPEKYRKRDSCLEIEPDDYLKLHKQLLNSTTKEREKMKGMEPVRVEMIVLATVFVNFVLQKSNINSILQSDYALKEGVVAELLNI